MKENLSSELVSKLQQIVLENIRNEQFGVEDLATKYGLSRSQLHKRLKKNIGKSVSQFIREVRLEEAMKLMKDGDLTVADVAYEVGFSSSTYFSTSFKDYYGYSPAEAKIRQKVGDIKGSFEKDISNLNRSKNRKWLIYTLGGIIAIALLFAVAPFKEDTEANIQARKEMLTVGNDKSQKRSIAVLPLKNWSGHEKLEYICDGMTDAIINKLSNISSIDKVTPHTSVLKYKDADKSITEIAEELGVGYIIQGSIQLSGNRIGINFQMIDGESEHQYWNKEFYDTWESDELFKLQAKVAENISQSIGAHLTDAEIIELNTIPTSNKEAYNLYLQANYEWSKGTRLGHNKAKRLYKEAIKEDSTFVDAYVNLSLVWSLGAAIWGYFDPAEAQPKAHEYLLKAKRIAPNNKKVMDLFLRISLLGEWDFAIMEDNYQKTLIAPLYLMYIGKYEEAEDYIKKAEKLKKANSPLYSQWRAETLFYNNKWAQALRIYNNDYEFYNDDYNWLRESTKYLYYMGEYEMAKERLDRLMQIFSDRPPIVIWLDAVLSESLGQEKKAKDKLDLLKETEKNTSSGSPAWFIALYYCHLKEYDTAFYWLNSSYQKHENEMIWLHSEPLLKPVRDDLRYLELHQKIGFPLAPLN